MPLTLSTISREQWMDALAALDNHDRHCQPCRSVIGDGIPDPNQRCADGQRLDREQFRTWQRWYEVRAVSSARLWTG